MSALPVSPRPHRLGIFLGILLLVVTVAALALEVWGIRSGLASLF